MRVVGTVVRSLLTGRYVRAACKEYEKQYGQGLEHRHVFSLRCRPIRLGLRLLSGKAGILSCCNAAAQGIRVGLHFLIASSQIQAAPIAACPMALLGAQDRLNTLAHVRDAGINVCAGGIIGLGEGPKDRVGLIHQLATLPSHPESVPINSLVAVAGTPLEGQESPTGLDMARWHTPWLTLPDLLALMSRKDCCSYIRAMHRVGLRDVLPKWQAAGALP